MMKELIKEPESQVLVRFQDCDPYGHLNNSKYLDYMLNVREDHLINTYDFDVFKMAKEEGRAWVVGHHEMTYVRPVFVMEKVIVQSRLINYTEKYVQAEMVMYDLPKTHVKAVLWTKFFHFDIKAQRGKEHSADHLTLFKNLLVPIGSEKIEERGRVLVEEVKAGLSREKVL